MDTPKSVSHMTEKSTEEAPSNEQMKMEDIEGIEDETDNSKKQGRTCKLSIFPSKHFFNQATACNTNPDSLQEEPEVVLNRDDFPYLDVGDIIAVYQPDVDLESDDSFPQLLLRVNLTAIQPPMIYTFLRKFLSIM